MIWVIFMQALSDAVIFKSKKLFLASEVHAILIRVMPLSVTMQSMSMKNIISNRDNFPFPNFVKERDIIQWKCCFSVTVFVIVSYVLILSSSRHMYYIVYRGPRLFCIFSSRMGHHVLVSLCVCECQLCIIIVLKQTCIILPVVGPDHFAYSALVWDMKQLGTLSYLFLFFEELDPKIYCHIFFTSKGKRKCKNFTKCKYFV